MGPNISAIEQIRAEIKFALLGLHHRPTAYKTGALAAELRAKLKYYGPPNPTPPFDTGIRRKYQSSRANMWIKWKFAERYTKYSHPSASVGFRGLPSPQILWNLDNMVFGRGAEAKVPDPLFS